MNLPELLPAYSARREIVAIVRCACMSAGVLLLAAIGQLAPAAEPTAEAAAPDQRKIDFGREIQPIFAKRCMSCHGPDKNKGGLRLYQRDGISAELDSGMVAVVPGDPDESELLRRIASNDELERMPLDAKPLEPGQIDLIRRWIAQGAPWEDHWAFQPPVPQTPPAVKDAAWVRNPIDSFILQRLEEKDLSPAPPADKVALLRRACYDLTGLPPSPADVDAFLADPSPDAYEKLIDRLLESPHYGEQWGRFWLDLVRYAETNSFERDGPKPNAWRYRDYVIRSFNADKPYDQFIREQLAGDELAEPTAEAIIATGYYRLGLWDDEPADPLQAKYEGLDDIVTTTSQVFLGLTVNCARCHDHKIDPIPQRDYYSMLAFFHNITPMTNDGPTIERPIKVGSESAPSSEPPKSDQPKPDKPEKPRVPSALCVTEAGPQAPETFVFSRGNAHVPGDLVPPAFPSIFGQGEPQIPAPSAAAKSCGRRTALANWIASADNRLTARVMVNRIWQHHFGRGIVRSPNNFGQLGDRPTHPELLDWLALEFVKGGWRAKPLHKLIMTSSAYRMSSQANDAGLKADPANDLFWRFDVRRLSAEEVRDSIHAINGRLNPQMHGPSFYPEISEEVLAGQSQPGNGWGKSPAFEQARRSVYIHVKRSLITPILADFDFADTDSSCAARFATTQPTQALGMLNGPFVNEQAAELAARLRREAGGDSREQIKLALRLATCREPDAKAIERGLQLLTTLREKHGVDADTALNYYCLMVLNLNEFVYLD